MSEGKHNSHGYSLSTHSGEKLVRRWIVQKRGGAEDVGKQALICGLVTAFPFDRLGLSRSSIGRRLDDRPHDCAVATGTGRHGGEPSALAIASCGRCSALAGAQRVEQMRISARLRNSAIAAADASRKSLRRALTRAGASKLGREAFCALTRSCHQPDAHVISRTDSFKETHDKVRI
jgi:hypothetical protein